MSTIKADVRRYIEENFLLGAGAVSPSDDDSFLEHQVLDSTGFLELVAHLEETYGFKIGDDEMVPENLDSLHAIEVFVKRKQGGGLMSAVPLGPGSLALDCEAELARIAQWIPQVLTQKLRRRGLVVAISGGIDSSVCAALSVRALGAKKVFGLLLPERDSSGFSTERGRQLAEHLGIEYQVHDIAPALEALGCYSQRDEAIRRVVPAYGDGWKNKIVIAGGVEGGINFFKLVVQSPDGEQQSVRLPLREYLQIVAATNFKQRVRKTMDYYHADRLNYAVVGTPNRLEYDQGFFVKNGDGAADLKPIAHLYKTQVYAMARHLGLPDAICNAVPTTDTYTLPQGQDEFYFALPYAQMDIALWALEHGRPAEELAVALQMTPAQAQRVYDDIRAKRRATEYLAAAPELIPG